MLDRKQLGRLVRLITGHCALRSHCHRVDKNEDASCRLCGMDSETILHLLNDCPSLTDARRDVFEGSAWLSEDGWEVDKLLDFSYHPEVKPLLLARTRPAVSQDSAQVAVESELDSGSGSESEASMDLALNE